MRGLEKYQSHQRRPVTSRPLGASSLAGYGKRSNVYAMIVISEKSIVPAIAPLAFAFALLLYMVCAGMWPPTFERWDGSGLPILDLNCSQPQWPQSSIIPLFLIAVPTLILLVYYVRTKRPVVLLRAGVWVLVLLFITVRFDGWLQYRTLGRFEVAQLFVIPVGAFVAWDTSCPRRAAIYIASVCTAVFWAYQGDHINETSYIWSLPRLVLPLILLLSLVAAVVTAATLRQLMQQSSSRRNSIRTTA